MDDFKDLLEDLSEQEKQEVYKILNEYNNNGESKSLNELYDEDFEEIPVDIDTFLEDENAPHLPFSMFNDVMVYPNKVILNYSPLHYRFDANNHTYGSCTFDDILNIKKIIEDRKAYYKANS